jgi:ATP-dependent Clp protease ATP-binding subunit ClpA
VADQLAQLFSHLHICLYTATAACLLLHQSGFVVNFKNTVIILTSNIGAEYLLQVKTQSDVAAAETAVLKAVHSRFRPEFLNRLDEILIFHRYVHTCIHVHSSAKTRASSSITRTTSTAAATCR